jgi:hypothetical protein
MKYICLLSFLLLAFVGIQAQSDPIKDKVSPGSVWFNTAYPLTLENIDDKILCWMAWEPGNPFHLEQMQRVQKFAQNRFQIQMISSILGDAEKPRSRREIFGIIQLENLIHPLVVCPDYNQFHPSMNGQDFTIRLYTRPGGKTQQVYSGEHAAEQAIEQMKTWLADENMLASLRSWQIKDSVETHYWADANIEFPTNISTLKGAAFFVTESNHHRIHLLSPSGKILSVMGSPIAGFEDGQFLQAQFNYPRGTVYDEVQKQLYVADTYNHRVRACDRQSDLVYTVAGNGNHFNQEIIATEGGYDPMGFPVDVTLDDNILYVLSAEFNQVFKLDPISGVSKEVARMPLTNELNQRIFPQHFDIIGKIGFVNFNDGSIFQLKFDEERTEKDIISQQERSYHYAHGSWFYQPKHDEPRMSSIAIVGKKLIATSYNTNQIWEYKKGNWTILAGDGTTGWKDGVGSESQFFHPADVVLYDNIAYVIDQDNESMRTIGIKKKKVETLPFVATEALMYAGNVVPQGESIVIDDIVLGEGLSVVELTIDPGEFILDNEGQNSVLLIDEAMGEQESESIVDGKFRVKIDPTKLVYGNLQFEMVFSCHHPARPQITLRKAVMVSLTVNVIPGEPNLVEVAFKPHILPY